MSGAPVASPALWRRSRAAAVWLKSSRVRQAGSCRRSTARRALMAASPSRVSHRHVHDHAASRSRSLDSANAGGTIVERRRSRRHPAPRQHRAAGLRHRSPAWSATPTARRRRTAAIEICHPGMLRDARALLTADRRGHVLAAGMCRSAASASRALADDTDAGIARGELMFERRRYELSRDARRRCGGSAGTVVPVEWQRSRRGSQVVAHRLAGYRLRAQRASYSPTCGQLRFVDVACARRSRSRRVDPVTGLKGVAGGSLAPSESKVVRVRAPGRAAASVAACCLPIAGRRRA